MVSKDVVLLRDEIDKRTVELSGKIEKETQTLSDKLEETRQVLLERVEAIFDRKFLGVVGMLIGAVPILYGGVTFLQQGGLTGSTVAFIAVVAGLVIIGVTYAVTRKA